MIVRRRGNAGFGFEFLHIVVGGVRRTIGLRRRAAQAFGFGHRVAETAQTLVAQRMAVGFRLLSSLPVLIGCRLGAHALGGFRFQPADRVFQRQTLAGDIGFVERRFDTAQLVDQRRTRALIKRATVLARILVEACDGAGDQGIIVSHYRTFSCA